MTYEEVEQIISEELNRERKVKTDGKRFEDIAIETIANDKLDKILKSVKVRIKNKMRPKNEKPRRLI